MTAGGGWVAVYRSLLTKYEGDADGLAGMVVLLLWTRFQRDGDLERGEVRISSRRLAAQLGWTRGKARWFIKRLEIGGEIRPSLRPTLRPTHGKAFYVVRYMDLQPAQKGSSPPDDPPSNPLVRKKKKGVRKGSSKREAKNSPLNGSTVQKPGGPPVTKGSPAHA